VENSRFALVLTGVVLPGHAPGSVWPALASYLHIDAAKLDQLRARAPLTIKRSDDLGKLQALQAGIAEQGAQTELCALDERPALFVLFDGVASGPLPAVYVEERIQHGLWPEGVGVAEVGAKGWRPWRELNPVPEVAPEPEVAPVEPPVEPVTWTSTEPAPVAEPVPVAELPPGAAIHAGFWRRCAALVIDSLLLGAVLALAQWLWVLQVGAAANTAGVGLDTAMLLPVMVAGVVLQWLYFALFESSRSQATPGKLALGIKVVDGSGRRIGFGRASGRFFGKFLSGAILNVGYMLAGWTARKQALHDMLAGTLVVFRAVQPDRPRPTVRPPMPWYGWVLNVLLIASMAALVVAALVSIAMLGEIADGALRGGSGF